MEENTKKTAYTLSDIQKTIGIITRYERQGVTDIRSIRTLLQRRIDNSRFETKKMEVHERAESLRLKKILNKRNSVPLPKPQIDDCPSCGRSKMFPARGVEEIVLVCPSCRYSEYRG